MVLRYINVVILRGFFGDGNFWREVNSDCGLGLFLRVVVWLFRIFLVVLVDFGSYCFFFIRVFEV